ATGRLPGRPRQTGQTFTLGSSPNPSAEQPQNSFVSVRRARWTSRPMTGSNMRTSLTPGPAGQLGGVSPGPNLAVTPAPASRTEHARWSGYHAAMVKVELEEIAVSGDENQFLALLRSPDGEILPIQIDALQAISIAAGRSSETLERPLTHDLMISVLELLGATISRVEVTDLVDGTYYAML